MDWYDDRGMMDGASGIGWAVLALAILQLLILTGILVVLLADRRRPPHL